MFRKPLAAATTALVAAIFAFGAVAAPAFADDGSGATPGSTTTTDSTTPAATTPDAAAAVAVTPATCTAPDILTLPTATYATWGTPSLTQGPGHYTVTATAADGHTFADGQTTETIQGDLGAAQDCTTPVVQDPALLTTTSTPETSRWKTPSLTCLPNSAVSYTYDRTTNSGTITVAQLDKRKYSKTLCHPFYVTAVGWRYLTSDEWPQGLVGYSEANGGEAISTVRSYDYGFPVTCGQGDIYANFSPVVRPPSTMASPSKGYQEYFLQDMPFNGAPGSFPTYMWTTGGPCQVIDSKVVAPTVTSSTECGVAGSISWTDDAEKVTYALTSGNGHSGVNLVTATAVAPWVFEDNTTTHVYTIDLGDPKVCDATPGDPSAVSAVCSDGASQNGAILVDFQPGVLSYTLIYPDGTKVPVTAASTSVPAGTYTVTVTAEPGYTLTGADQWPLEVTVDPAVDCGDLPTDAVLPTSVTSTAASCSTGSGSITVGPTADYLAFIDYSIDGQKVSGVTTSVKPGTHVVTAAVNQTTAPGDTLDDPGPWTVTIAAASVACGQLKTLALTGTSPAVPLLAAGILLPAGAALLLGAALIRRRRES